MGEQVGGDGGGRDALHDAARERPVVTGPQGAAATAADDDAAGTDVAAGERTDVDGEEHDRAYWSDASDEAPGSPGRPRGTGAREQGPDTPP